VPESVSVRAVALGRSTVRALARSPRWVLVTIGVVVVLMLGYFAVRAWSTEDVQIEGLPAHQIRPEAVSDVRVRAGDSGNLRVSIDGRPVRVADVRGAAVPAVQPLADGPHQLRIDAPRALPWLGSTTTTRQFTVDTAPPDLRVADSLRPDHPGTPVTVTGTATGAAQVIVAGQSVVPDGRGAFSAVVQRPDREVTVVATDLAGNRAEKTLSVHIKHPPMRAVHMTGLAWTSDTLREPVLEMAREHKIDTVELDIKDEDGQIPYDSAVPTARQIRASKGYYDARQVLDELHGMGVRVVGRLVAFKDPALGRASWLSGNPQRVVQTPDGKPWSNGGYGDYSFTNFADPVVRQYNIDIASEAASLGFDDILYDYVRRPDGPIEQMRFPGLTGTPEASIADFLRQTQTAVRAHGALLGASVFGVSINRHTEIAQDIRQMSQYVDYIAPMVYPSHWASGEFGVEDPNHQPYDIVQRSLAAFAQAVQGTDVQIDPWLQDFSLGAPYGPPEVSAQIAAANADGMSSFLLWSPECRYHDQALTTH
jgi:hypothetical protein